MKYTIYKTTNKVNKKIYIGFHITENPEDDYLGSGTALQRAITKYGKEAFEKEVLFVFDNPEDMFAKEAELVTEEFLTRPDVYNIKLGGLGGWDFVNKNKLTNWDHINKTGKNPSCSKDSVFRKFHIERIREGILKARQNNPEKFHYIPTFLGNKHTEKTKKRIGEANKKMIGDKNGAFGTCWVTNEKENKRIPKENLNEYENKGFRKGRIIKNKNKIISV